MLEADVDGRCFEATLFYKRFRADLVYSIYISYNSNSLVTKHVELHRDQAIEMPYLLYRSKDIQPMKK